ncbi:hypothetical protein LI82_09335 [Methanococcoides methylutens]|uniref:Uncharacterized protein n=1 Tax=Methanococcoides methylutens TaxID=2226 RepID=A0A099SYD4_METMT|nr:hypothetical protein [Methanococcoides methylutens]KGK97945.1 hypothetical protein LI82_09335 [Methanococcoides methylutens]
MVEPEEIEGMADALGAVTHDEIVELAQELAYKREENIPDEEEITIMLEKAVSKHLLEAISIEELSEADAKNSEDVNYYIVGPHAFPKFPFDLSEVIDILKLARREVDPYKITKRFSGRLKARITKLRHNIEDFANGDNDSIDIPTLENRYSDLLNLYYDYDSWLEGEITEMEDEILDISKQIDALGAAQDI